jgi:uncharacterized protein
LRANGVRAPSTEKPADPLIPSTIIHAVRARFALDWNGIHGAAHWARVRLIGLRLAERTGACREVVELFAFLHDSCRRNDGHDPLHGKRAAAFAQSLHGHAFELGQEDLRRLLTACRGHSDGHSHGDVTIATCWDSDRLDLGRVGVRPDPRRLCTPAAREPQILRWASALHDAPRHPSAHRRW